MEYEPKNEERRREQDFERLGNREPKCNLCHERDPKALTGTHPDIYCAEHEAEIEGRTRIQGQHPPGKRNDPVTKLPTRANDHVVWDEAKNDWPKWTLRNPDGSPLLRAAAAVRSVLDWFRLIIDRVLGWVPKFLEDLDTWLTENLGSDWWNGIGFEGVGR